MFNCMKVIPARYVLAVLVCFGMANLFAMIVILNVSIVAMVDNTDMATTNQTVNFTTCEELMPNMTNVSYWNEEKVLRRRGSYNWDAKTQSIVLSAFYYGFTVSMIPGGVLAQKCGGKRLFSLSILTSSILTLLIPHAAEWGAVPLALLRVLEGLVLGIVFPARNVLVSHWIPVVERSRFMTYSTNGGFIGVLAGMLLGGVFADLDFLGGWPATFYVFGLFGCLWFVFWTFLVYEEPSFHPWISDAELNLIQTGLNTTNRIANSDIPWLAILKSIPLWALIISAVGNAWLSTVLMVEMPTYLSNILHFDMKMNGLFSSLPYVLQVMVNTVAGHVTDKLIESGKFSITAVQKLMNSISFYVCGICILLVSFVGCRAGISVALLSATIAFSGIGTCVMVTIMVDMSPTYTAPLTGISYGLLNVAGSLSPIAIGEIISTGQTLENWNKVFIITAAILFSSGTIFNLFGSAEVQPWGSDSPESQSKRTVNLQVTDRAGYGTDNKNEITKF